MYSSVDPQIKTTLAEASWQEFRRFVSRDQWAFDDPSHSPRKEEIAQAIRNCGKPGACTFLRGRGYKYVLPVLHARHFEKAVAHRRKLYYVSHGRHALLYLDIDLHHAWQTATEGNEAKRLIDALLCRFFGEPSVFWMNSRRGINGYLKVDLCGERAEVANKVLGRLEEALQRFLASYDNLADFEVKGKIEFLRDGGYAWAQYGKLPVHAADWSFARLEEFKQTPTLPLRGLQALCRRIEAAIPADVLTRHKLYKKGLGEAPPVKDGYFLITPDVGDALVETHGEGWQWLFQIRQEEGGRVWMALRHHRPGAVPLTEAEIRAGNVSPSGILAAPASTFDRLDAVPNDDSNGLPAATHKHEERKAHHERDDSEPDCLVQRDGGALRLGTDEQGRGSHRVATPGAPDSKNVGRGHRITGVFIDDLLTEPDSLKRQHEALLRLARHLKRVPSLEEALHFLRSKKLYTGPWDEHLARRTARVRSILSFVGRTFFANKCGDGSVNLGKYDAWATKHFPSGLVGKGRKGLTPAGQVVESGPGIHVNTTFIATFLAVCEFALVIDRNEDGTLPHQRAEQLWYALHLKGLVHVKFCARKWAVCRESLVKFDIIKITNRDYGPGKAMEWAPGPYFPFLGLWKTKKLPSLIGAVKRKVFSRRKEGTTTEDHNTLLRKQPDLQAVPGRFRLSRPPPVPPDGLMIAEIRPRRLCDMGESDGGVRIGGDYRVIASFALGPRFSHRLFSPSPSGHITADDSLEKWCSGWPERRAGN